MSIAYIWKLADCANITRNKRPLFTYYNTVSIFLAVALLTALNGATPVLEQRLQDLTGNNKLQASN